MTVNPVIKLGSSIEMQTVLKHACVCQGWGICGSVGECQCLSVCLSVLNGHSTVA